MELSRKKVQVEWCESTQCSQEQQAPGRAGAWDVWNCGLSRVARELGYYGVRCQAIVCQHQRSEVLDLHEARWELLFLGYSTIQEKYSRSFCPIRRLSLQYSW